MQIKRINYVEQVRQRVYERMISERKKVAAQFRSEGEGEKADILGQMEKELKTIQSEAYRLIRGNTGVTPMPRQQPVYAGAYGKDPRILFLYDGRWKPTRKQSRTTAGSCCPRIRSFIVTLKSLK